MELFKIGSAFPSYTTELGIMTSQTELPTQKIFLLRVTNLVLFFLIICFEFRVIFEENKFLVTNSEIFSELKR